LPTVVSVQFKSLRCSELEGLGVRYLRADSSIDCDSPEYDLFVGNIVGLFIVYLCIPLAYLGLLYRVSDRLHTTVAGDNDDVQQKRLNEAALRLQEENDPELRPLKFLYKGYRPQYWYAISLRYDLCLRCDGGTVLYKY
jgi:hypothetical protein